MCCEQCAFLSVFATPECPICRKYSGDGSVHKLCNIPALFYSESLSLYSYTKVVKKLLHVYKYSYAFQYQREIERLVDEYFRCDPFLVLQKWVAHLSNKFIIILPVPMTKRKQEERGFSPAYELAIIIGREIQRKYSATVNICTTLFQKVTDGQAQARKNREKRLITLGKNYRINETYVQFFLQQKFDVLIVIDDVLTTGATMTVLIDLLKIHPQLCEFVKNKRIIRISFASS